MAARSIGQGPRRRSRGWALVLTGFGLFAAIVSNPPTVSATGTIAKPVADAGWHLKSVPFPPDWQSTLAPDTLTSVSCATANSCMAVGQYHDGFTYVPLIEHWNGTRWSAMPAPAPATTRIWHDDVLYRVSCPTASWCVAVGHFDVYGKPSNTFPNGVRSYPYSAVYDGSGWSSVSAAAVKLDDGTGELVGVSCPKLKQCVAVSFTSKKGQRGGTFRFDGHRWKRLAAVPRSRGYSTDLLDLSCTKLTYCQAISDVQTATWNGKKWSLKAVGKGKTLVDLDCPATKRCVAVGGTSTGPVGTSTHSELLAGGRWHAIPKARDQAKGLAVVSCPTTKSCYTAGGYYRPYIAHWNAASGRWAVTTPARPSGYYTVTMTALDCPTAKFCMGVGELDPNSTSTADGLTSWEFVG
jgi:hypothetical protein